MNEPKPQCAALAANLFRRSDGAYAFQLYASRAVLSQILAEEWESFTPYTVLGYSSYVLITISPRYNVSEVMAWLVAYAEELHKEFELDRALEDALGG